jgi:hypothetical protein
LNVCSGSLPTRIATGLHCQGSLDIVLNLPLVSDWQMQNRSFYTLVTLVPAKKNTISRAKGRLHGCTACAAAVNRAATIPAGVRDLCE